ncbi:MAG: conjugated bile salt MFS transporter [Peptostreptococcaceae bacterium]
MSSLEKKKFASGWVIVVACMLIQAIPFGVASNIQPQFMAYILDPSSGYGFTQAGFSLIFTLGTVVSAVASPFIGALYNKINVKTMYLAGTILSGGGFLAFSMCKELWQFYVVAGIVQVGTATISSIGVPLLINRWFDDLSKGKALGLAFAGGSIGNIFLQSMTAFALNNYSISQSYMMFGILSLAVGVPITLFFLRMPKDDSEVVRGKQPENVEVKNDDTVEWGYTFNEAKNVKFFWIFALGLFFLGMYVSALAVQYPAYFKGHLEIDPMIVGMVGSIFAIFSLGGNLFGGVIFDKLGITKGLIVAFVLSFTSCLAVIFTNKMPILAQVFAGLKGLSVFAYMMGPSLLAGSFFGKKEFGAILGVVQIFFAVGFAAGSSVFGLLVDNFGYGAAWNSVAIYIVICYGSLIAASVGMAKLNKTRIEELKAK